VAGFTIGQRRGLGLAGGGPPRFVLAADRSTATVTVGSADDLRVDAQPVEALGWAAAPTWGAVEVQSSAHGRAVAGELRRDGEDPGRGVVHWRRPERRVAPGQSVVFYDGDEVVGGGVAAPIG
jgi:tRNA-specific 2-thiouridylase